MPSSAWMRRGPPSSSLFPYTTLFRSHRAREHRGTRPVAPGGEACRRRAHAPSGRSEEHTSELQSRRDLVCRLLLGCGGGHRALASFPTRRSSDPTAHASIEVRVQSRPAAKHAVDELTHPAADRKSTRLNSSHVEISYAVFCLDAAGATEL